MNKKIFLIGGGSSLKNFNFNLLKNQDTIAINQSIFDCPFSKYFITMDYTFLQKINLMKFKNLKLSKFFIANFSSPYLRIINNKITDIRNPKTLTYDLAPFDVVIYSNKIQGIGFEWNDFRNGESSGYCALQLAVLLNYTEIYLLGFDLTIINNKTHYHDKYFVNPDFDKNLEKYYNNFITALFQLQNSNIKIYSCSPVSKLNNHISFVKIKDVLDD